MKGCRPLTDPEVVLVSRSFGGTYAARDRALFLLGVKSGFRIAELLSLRLHDLLQHERLVEYLTVERRHMKGGKAGKTSGRTVPLHPEAKAALASWLLTLRQQPGVTGETYIFRSRKGGNRPISPVQAWRILRDACDANELSGKLGTHCMRKTFAQKVYKRLGHDLVKTQSALGHVNISNTARYISFAQEEIDQAILAI
jgi:integrase